MQYTPRDQIMREDPRRIRVTASNRERLLTQELARLRRQRQQRRGQRSPVAAGGGGGGLRRELRYTPRGIAPPTPEMMPRSRGPVMMKRRIFP